MFHTHIKVQLASYLFEAVCLHLLLSLWSPENISSNSDICCKMAMFAHILCNNVDYAFVLFCRSTPTANKAEIESRQTLDITKTHLSDILLHTFHISVFQFRQAGWW